MGSHPGNHWNLRGTGRFSEADVTRILTSAQRMWPGSTPWAASWLPAPMQALMPSFTAKAAWTSTVSRPRPWARKQATHSPRAFPPSGSGFRQRPGVLRRNTASCKSGALWYNGREAALLLSRKEAIYGILDPEAEETEALGAALLSSLRPGQVVAFRGPLGAGKTAFTRGLALGLGVTGPGDQPHLHHCQRIHRRTHAPVPL